MRWVLIILVGHCIGLHSIGAVDEERCRAVTRKPIPTQSTLRKTTADGKGTCLIASMQAYFKLGNNSYVELGGGHTLGDCAEDPTLEATSDQFVFEFTCGAVVFYLNRADAGSPWSVVGILVRSAALDLFHYGPIQDESMRVRQVNHSYRCESEQSIQVRNGSSGQSLCLVLSDMTIEAFRDRSEPALYQTQDRCPSDGSGIRWGMVLILSGAAVICVIVIIAGNAITKMGRDNARTEYGPTSHDTSTSVHRIKRNNSPPRNSSQGLMLLPMSDIERLRTAPVVHA